MATALQTWQIFLAGLAAWVNQQPQAVTDDLREEHASSINGSVAKDPV